MPALPLPAYLYRIHIEERALPAALGASYAAYMRRTWRLVPGLR
jgi:protein-S-isoprenylcysteine O-methyltransferase Ste14